MVCLGFFDHRQSDWLVEPYFIDYDLEEHPRLNKLLGGQKTIQSLMLRSVRLFS